MFYLVKTPRIVEKYLYPGFIWSMPGKEKKLYLSFDDGPHPKTTNFILDELKRFNAKASFFCVGKNVVAHPDIYSRIITEGHRVGNHTHDHLNGWKVNDEEYFKNIAAAAKYIDSFIFRPPYGRITRFQAKQVMDKFNFEIIMWSVLSGDFDNRISPQVCWQNVFKAAKPGSIIVFHDSERAMERMSFAFTKTLEYYRDQGYAFDKIP